MNFEWFDLKWFIAGYAVGAIVVGLGCILITWIHNKPDDKP